MELLRLFDGDVVVAQVTREEARYLVRETNQAMWINRAQDIRWLRPLEDTRCEMEKVIGCMVDKEMRHCALNRGRVGQFTIGYPIPYAYEGTFNNCFPA